jgi:hypothetical protein
VSDHYITLHYTNDDDGIHMWCSCDPTLKVVDVNLGYSPTFGEIDQARREHLSFYDAPTPDQVFILAAAAVNVLSRVSPEMASVAALARLERAVAPFRDRTKGVTYGTTYYGGNVDADYVADLEATVKAYATLAGEGPRGGSSRQHAIVDELMGWAE